MRKNLNYITQLTRRDFADLARAANAYGGDGIDVAQNDDGLEIRIDKGQLERWIKTVMQGGHLQ